MRRTGAPKRYRLAARHRSAERGVTLIELLLGIALLAVLTSFLAAGLSTGRRAFEADRVSGTDTETDAAIQAVASVIASALPVRPTSGDQQANVIFDGRQGGLSFVALSEGRSLRGGPHRISLRQSGRDLVMEVAPPPAPVQRDTGSSIPRIVVLSGVRAISFAYFGRTRPTAAASWRPDWVGAEQLPDLVSIRVDFEDKRRNEPAAIVALRQG